MMAASSSHHIDFHWVEPSFSMPSWMLASRQHYFDAFNRNGLPTKKEERFRYTDLSIIQKQLLLLAEHEKSTSKDVVVNNKLTKDTIRLVFRNQLLQPALSDLHLLPDGVIACSLKEAILHHEALVKEVWPAAFDVSQQPLACLNLASFDDGFFLYVSPSIQITQPLHFLHLESNAAGSTINGLQLIIMGDDSKVSLFEEVVASQNQPALINQVCSILLHKNAVFDHVILNDAHNESLYWRTTTVASKECAKASFVSCFLGGKFTRHDLTCCLQSPFSHCSTSAFYRANQSSYIDNHIEIQHLAPHTTSDMLFKGTIADRAKAVFNGRLFVEKNAQKIVAYQANHHLLFSDLAESYSKPELEIYADDVKCKHGATTAAFDSDAIFYLRSRGITEQEAKELLLQAFLQSILDRIVLPSEFVSHIRNSVKDGAHDA